MAAKRPHRLAKRGLGQTIESAICWLIFMAMGASLSYWIYYIISVDSGYSEG